MSNQDIKIEPDSLWVNEESMRNQEILEKAIQRSCLQCGTPLIKKPKQSYAQYARQKYCTHACNASGPHKDTSIAKDKSNLHKFWRRRIPKPANCELCREPAKLALSNRSGEYQNVITDWWYLCYVCHGRYDAIGFKIWEVRRSYVE